MSRAEKLLRKFKLLENKTKSGKDITNIEIVADTVQVVFAGEKGPAAYLTLTGRNKKEVMLRLKSASSIEYDPASGEILKVNGKDI